MKKIVPNDAVLIPDQAKCMFQGEIFGIYQWSQKRFDGSEATWEMVKRQDTIQVIAIVDDQVLVLDEEQPHSGRKLGFITGRIDDTDTSPLQAAQRECAEETGFTFENWKLVDVFQPHTKIEWFVHTFVVSGAIEQKPTAHDTGEKIQVEQWPYDKIKQEVLNDTGYLGEGKKLFRQCSSTAELLELPEFDGQEVDR